MTKKIKKEEPLIKGPQRFRICSDESGHDYFIPVELVDQFYAWVESCEDDTESGYDGPGFDDHRIDGRFTFTDPRCE